MKKKSKGVRFVLFLICAVFAWSASAQAQTGGTPPIGQTLVREGDYAVRLAYALRVASTDNEIEAESRLGEIGITPADGWIADYPVTPDIMAQLQAGVVAAADGGKLIVGRNDAIKYMNDLNGELGLPIVSASSPGTPPPVAQSPAPVIINNYYASAGPPVVTYYAPPPAWVYMYAWVPYPFWCAGFRFSGYYILRDFDRVVVVRNRPFHLTNRYWDGHRRIYRAHPPRPAYRAAPPAHSPRPLPRVMPVPRAEAPAPRVAAPLPRVAAPLPRVAAPLPRVAAPLPRAAAPNPSVAAPVSRATPQSNQVKSDRHREERRNLERRVRVERAEHSRRSAERPERHGSRSGRT